MWAICSRAALQSPRVLLAALLLALGAALPARAQVRLNQDAALRLAFPAPASIERRTAFLAAADLAAVRLRAGADVEPPPAVVTYYVGRAADGRALGVAYFDAHRVRTMREVVMFVVTPEGRIGRTEVLAFHEPPEYAAPEGWLGQFRGRALDARLSTKGGIVNMTGATLTSQAVTRAARRVLALHEAIHPLASGKSATR